MPEPVPTTIGDLMAHPGWDDGTWRDEQGRDLFDVLFATLGYEQAFELWLAACNYTDHLEYLHSGGECDC